ncbi:MarR family winged helix-turn-helix transcriptional regulator [Singulisphaera sp. PoT]|uniref:MarR family winged helix-turn-helix transcriptional regulator n=1 Tax=Singulisphaera sp. PoT TaxID=3411797 RepID=UPI003BF4CB4B
MGEEYLDQIAAECLVGRIRALNRIVSGIFDAKLRPYGVRSSQINILTVVALKGPIAPAGVCRRLQLERSTLSRDMERLVENGWITSTPGVGRGLLLEPTDKGLALLRTLKPAWDEAQAETVARLGPDLVRELYQASEDGRLGDLEDD